MEKVTIQDNESVQYVALSPVKPQLAFHIKEESAQHRLRDYNFDGVSSLTGTQAVDPVSETIYGGQNNIALNSNTMPTDYVGATSVNVPHYILETYADFKYYDLQSITPQSLLATVNSDTLANLYDVDDADLKIVTVINGLQFLRIPPNRFNDVDGDGQVTNQRFGKYYINVTPKCIQATVLGISQREQLDFETINTNANNNQSLGKRRRTYQIDKAGFYNTPWLFENNPFQRGRMYGSVVEVWDANLTTLKQTLILNEDNLALDNPNSYGDLGLHPELVGYDAASQAITLGDILKVYPRESYFTPIVIELTYSGTQDVLDLVRFMMNDVVQDTTRGIYEVYDENGVTTDGQGNISGTVILSYQISQEGKYTVRRNNPISTNIGNTIQDL